MKIQSSKKTLTDSSAIQKLINVPIQKKKKNPSLPLSPVTHHEVLIVHFKKIFLGKQESRVALGSAALGQPQPHHSSLPALLDVLVTNWDTESTRASPHGSRAPLCICSLKHSCSSHLSHASHYGTINE